MSAVAALFAAKRSGEPPKVGFWKTVKADMGEARAELDEWLFKNSGGLVQSGPFKGMVLPRRSAWKDTRLSPMILGCYEEELHNLLRQHIERLSGLENPRVVVIGCADGYYAVGLKRAVPKATVFGIDDDGAALEILKEAAAANSVQVETGRDLDDIFHITPDLIFSDCEGAEVGYFDPIKFPAVVGAPAIIEIHNFAGQNTDQILLDRFRGSHRIDMLCEGPRDPNRFEQLHHMTSEYRWLAVSEGRPVFMCWFHMIPRGAALA